MPVLFAMNNEYNIFESYNINILINDDVWKVWNKYRQKTIFSREACGVLIGGVELKTKTIIVEQCTEPMKNDRRQRTSFTLRDDGHQIAVDYAFQVTEGKQFYLGTWHTHPEPHPSPSYLDEQDWRDCIYRNSDIPSFIFAIVGTKSVSLFPKGKIKNYDFQNT